MLGPPVRRAAVLLRTLSDALTAPCRSSPEPVAWRGSLRDGRGDGMGSLGTEEYDGCLRSVGKEKRILTTCQAYKSHGNYHDTALSISPRPSIIPKTDFTSSTGHTNLAFFRPGNGCTSFKSYASFKAAPRLPVQPPSESTVGKPSSSTPLSPLRFCHPGCAPIPRLAANATRALAVPARPTCATLWSSRSRRSAPERSLASSSNPHSRCVEDCRTLPRKQRHRRPCVPFPPHPGPRSTRT